MTVTPKRRAVVSYENMSDELAAAFAEKYPKGYSDYFPDLVKIKVKTDDAEDLERWLDGEDGDDTEGNDDDSLPDDNISQYSNGDDDVADGE